MRADCGSVFCWVFGLDSCWDGLPIKFWCVPVSLFVVVLRHQKEDGSAKEWMVNDQVSDMGIGVEILRMFATFQKFVLGCTETKKKLATDDVSAGIKRNYLSTI